MNAPTPNGVCESVRRDLEGFVLRRLDAAEMGSVRAHLASCDACAAEADEVSRVMRGLRGGLAARRADRALGSVAARRFGIPALAACAVLAVVASLRIPGDRGAAADRDPRTSYDGAVIARARASAARYLVRTQREDGGWTAPTEVTASYLGPGLTALASLALLRLAVPGDVAEDAARRGLDRLAHPNRDSEAKDGVGASPLGYEVELRATVARALAAGAARWPDRFREPATEALAALRSMQGADGAFGAPVAEGGSGGFATLLAWHALREGERADLAVAGLRGAVARASHALARSMGAPAGVPAAAFEFGDVADRAWRSTDGTRRLAGGGREFAGRGFDGLGFAGGGATRSASAETANPEVLLAEVFLREARSSWNPVRGLSPAESSRRRGEHEELAEIARRWTSETTTDEADSAPGGMVLRMSALAFAICEPSDRLP